MKSDILSFKTVINELDFLRKTVIIKRNTMFTDTCKQIDNKILDPRNTKNIINFKKTKQKISKAIKNKYLLTKSY